MPIYLIGITLPIEMRKEAVRQLRRRIFEIKTNHTFISYILLLYDNFEYYKEKIK
ncbi:hypothetical protein Hanom_Chr00s000001g01597701 [Helianthus anomalus]